MIMLLIPSFVGVEFALRHAWRIRNAQERDVCARGDPNRLLLKIEYHLDGAMLVLLPADHQGVSILIEAEAMGY